MKDEVCVGREEAQRLVLALQYGHDEIERSGGDLVVSLRLAGWALYYWERLNEEDD